MDDKQRPPSNWLGGVAGSIFAASIAPSIGFFLPTIRYAYQVLLDFGVSQTLADFLIYLFLFSTGWVVGSYLQKIARNLNRKFRAV